MKSLFVSFSSIIGLQCGLTSSFFTSPIGPFNAAGNCPADSNIQPSDGQEISVFPLYYQADSKDDLATKSDSSGSAVTVRFKASTNVCTSSLPMPPSGKTIDEFFLSREHRNLLFAAGAGIREIENPSERQMQSLWRESEAGRRRCHMYPRDETAITRIIELTNPSLQFIGIKLISVVVVGTQLLLGFDENGKVNENRPFPGFPEFQFTLLDSSFAAEGPRPLVWVFNKITKRQDSKESNKANDTNKGESPSENNGPIRTIGFTRVWSQPTEDGKVTFCAETRLESQLLIPRMLVRLLPVTLDRIEEQGRAALQTLLKRMLKRMLNRQWSDFTKLVSNGFHVLLIL